jgi:hypothetical protein
MLTVHLHDGPQTIEVKLSSPDQHVFREALESFKWWIPAYHRNYNSAWRTWYVKWDATTQLFEWIKQVREAFGAKIEGMKGPWTEYRKPNWQSSYDAPPPRRERHVESEYEAYQVLHLLPSAPAPLIKAAYRELAKIKHPDHGGNDEEMKRINSAFDVLKGRLAA